MSRVIEPPDRGAWVVVVAAGGGARFGALKQYEAVAGRRVLDWSVQAARSVASGIVLVVPPAYATRTERGVDVVVTGGETRSASVRAGLAVVPDDVDVLVVHDAARPLASPALFSAVVDAVRGGADAAVPAVPVVDTVRRRAGGALDREGLVAVQTPQGFRTSVLRAAHDDQPEATDDASLVEAAGGRLVVVDGERWNLKITERSDLAVVAALMER